MRRAAGFATAISFVASLAAAEAKLPFPVALGGPYELTDQFGKTRTQADPNGHAQLIFFGYANCPNICSATYPLMGEIAKRLEAEGYFVTPVMITIDPEQDRVDNMAEPLGQFHDRFIGLTGSPDALKEAYAAFNVTFEKLFLDPEYGWIYSHTGFLHLMDGSGELLTVLPPVLEEGQMTKIVRSYVAPSG
ncbi:MAG: SCO family protein [Pseudomonadota bacterium]